MKYIVDNNTYILGKDKHNKDVTNHEVHDVLFKIILEIDRICRKNDIDYALAFGSALGIYNYGGFIPWDDDADIVINYFDRYRFIEALKNDLGEDFVFECYEEDNRYNILLPAMKIRYKHSEIKERNQHRLPNRVNKSNGLFVDITYLMGTCSKEKKHRRILKRSQFAMPLYVLLDSFLHINPKGMKKRLKKFEEKHANKYKDSDFISQSVIMPFQVFPLKKYRHVVFPMEIIYPFKEYNFNGHQLYSFNNLEGFLFNNYGPHCFKVEKDGEMVDPFPKEKRNSGHLLRIDIDKK